MFPHPENHFSPTPKCLGQGNEHQPTATKWLSQVLRVRIQATSRYQAWKPGTVGAAENQTQAGSPTEIDLLGSLLGRVHRGPENTDPNNFTFYWKSKTFNIFLSPYFYLTRISVTVQLQRSWTPPFVSALFSCFCTTGLWNNAKQSKSRPSLRTYL